MPYPNKPLAEMTPDEIAQLSPEDFKELAASHKVIREAEYHQASMHAWRGAKEMSVEAADLLRSQIDRGGHETTELAKTLEHSHAYNDELELRENAVNRQIEHKSDERAEAMQELINTSKRMLSPDEWNRLPFVNDERFSELAPTQHGIPNASDPANPYKWREATGTPLERLADKAWGRTRTDAMFDALHEPEKPMSSNNDNELEPSNDADVDALLNKLVEDRIDKHSGVLGKLADQQREPEPEKFGKPLIPAIIQAVRELPGTVREKMNSFETVAKRKYVYEEDLEKDHDHSNSRW